MLIHRDGPLHSPLYSINVSTYHGKVEVNIHMSDLCRLTDAQAMDVEAQLHLAMDAVLKPFSIPRPPGQPINAVIEG